jgi:hypothetical protein
VLTVSPSFYLGRCESPLGSYSNDSHEPSPARPSRLPAAPEIREGGAKRGGPVAGQWRYELNGRGNTATDFAFESEVFLHSGFLHGECDGSLCPRRGRHASIACEGEKFRFARSLFRSA